MREALAEVVESEREEALAKLVAEQFGIALSSLSISVVRSLLEVLPPDPTTADRRMLEQILSACSIGETMFLRHAEHFDALRALLPTLPARSSEEGELRVWSAGCASGEEAYSLAATLIEGASAPFSILATDLNPAAISRARDAHYRLWSLRGVELEDVDGWLEIDGLDVEVRPPFRSSVHFDVLNLARDAYPDDLDMIFCRNVLMYFRPEAADRVLRRMAASVRPGGVLFLGYVDPGPTPGTGWVEERVGETRYFRRQERPNVVAAGRIASLPAAREGGAPPAALGQVRRPERPLAVPRRLARRPAELDEVMAMARGLAAQRAFDEAIRMIQETASSRRPLDPEPYALLALVAEDAGRQELALAAARRCCFLAPEASVAHFLVGACLKRRGERQLAHRRLRHARRLLDRVAEADLPLPYGEGLTGRQLRRMIDVQIADLGD